jgi:16S rRNA (cytosine1402-N4)-methyltransferase
VSDKYFHIPILKEQIIELLNLKKKSIIVDATCGEGGHSEAIAGLIPRGRLICIDRNADILSVARERLKPFTNVDFFNLRFDRLSDILDSLKIDKVDGILADLGISMFHFKTDGMGFSYTDDGSLDMRLDEDGISAQKVINTFKESEIADIIYRYGEEHESRSIARAIIKSRPLGDAKSLAEVVLRAKKKKFSRGIHPATKTFQALRIYVNDELATLEGFIPVAVERLNPKGRLIIMSFHSLEDRIVKFAFRDLKSKGIGEILTKKPLVAGEEEVVFNPASRSAKLRCFEKS